MRGSTAVARVLSLLGISGALLLVPSSVVGRSVARADSLSDLKAQQAGVQQKKAKLAAQLDTLKANDSQLTGAVETLKANVGAQRGALLKADAASQAARSAADEAAAAESSAQAEFDAARLAIKQTAILSYAGGGFSQRHIDAGDVNEVSRAETYSAVATGERTDALDQLNAASKDLSSARQTKDRAAKAAADRLTAAQRQLGQLNDALSSQLGFEGKVRDHIDQELSEAEGLQSLDSSLADKITSEQLALASKLATRPTSSGPPQQIGDLSLVTVDGITVASSIGPALGSMISAASGAGLTLGGSGYRSEAQQIELRRQHCGSSDYDVYDKPSSQCSPPTARPGQSMHERGLAVDFTCNGSLIQSHGNPCWQWMSAHASGYASTTCPAKPGTGARTEIRLSNGS